MFVVFRFIARLLKSPKIKDVGESAWESTNTQDRGLNGFLGTKQGSASNFFHTK